jgi:hypothetical protein
MRMPPPFPHLFCEHTETADGTPCGDPAAKLIISANRANIPGPQLPETRAEEIRDEHPQDYR